MVIEDVEVIGVAVHTEVEGVEGAGIGMRDAVPHIILEVALEDEEVIGVAFEAGFGEGTEVGSEDEGAEEVVDPLHQGMREEMVMEPPHITPQGRHPPGATTPPNHIVTEALHIR